MASVVLVQVGTDGELGAATSVGERAAKESAVIACCGVGSILGVCSVMGDDVSSLLPILLRGFFAQRDRAVRVPRLQEPFFDAVLLSRFGNPLVRPVLSWQECCSVATKLCRTKRGLWHLIQQLAAFGTVVVAGFGHLRAVMLRPEVVLDALSVLSDVKGVSHVDSSRLDALWSQWAPHQGVLLDQLVLAELLLARGGQYWIPAVRASTRCSIDVPGGAKQWRWMEFETPLLSMAEVIDKLDALAKQWDEVSLWTVDLEVSSMFGKTAFCILRHTVDRSDVGREVMRMWVLGGAVVLAGSYETGTTYDSTSCTSRPWQVLCQAAHDVAWALGDGSLGCVFVLCPNCTDGSWASGLHASTGVALTTKFKLWELLGFKESPSLVVEELPRIEVVLCPGCERIDSCRPLVEVSRLAPSGVAAVAQSWESDSIGDRTVPLTWSCVDWVSRCEGFAGWPVVKDYRVVRAVGGSEALEDVVNYRRLRVLGIDVPISDADAVKVRRKALGRIMSSFHAELRCSRTEADVDVAIGGWVMLRCVAGIADLGFECAALRVECTQSAPERSAFDIVVDVIGWYHGYNPDTISTTFFLRDKWWLLNVVMKAAKVAMYGADCSELTLCRECVKDVRDGTAEKMWIPTSQVCELLSLGCGGSITCRHASHRSLSADLRWQLLPLDPVQPQPPPKRFALVYSAITQQPSLLAALGGHRFGIDHYGLPVRLEDAARRFVQRLSSQFEVALFHFSGHGGMVDADQLLVDGGSGSARLGSVCDILERARGCGTVVVILDCCRSISSHDYPTDATWTIKFRERFRESAQGKRLVLSWSVTLRSTSHQLLWNTSRS